MTPLARPRAVTPPRLAATLAVVATLGACGPVTAPVTGAYGPAVSRTPHAQSAVPNAAPAQTPAPSVAPTPYAAPGPVKVEPLAPPAPESVQRHAERAAGEGTGAREHVVQPGETVYSIARRYNVTTAELMRANGIPPAFTIKIGQRLALPDGAAVPVDVARAEVSRPETAQPAVQAPSAPASPPASNALSSGAAAETAEPPPQPSAALPELAHPPPIAPRKSDSQAAPDHGAPNPATLASLAPPSRAGRTFHWPVRGRVISDYGAKGQGLKNDGINIAAPRGTPVLAAENGVVAYTGNELKGFGNLILIRHADGWVTAYAHNEALLVSKGETVRRGQAIARVGMTGNVREPQLHFEVRRSRIAVDPTHYLDGEGAPAERPQAFSPGANRDGRPGPG